jgi:hypothetical protein
MRRTITSARGRPVPGQATGDHCRILWTRQRAVRERPADRSVRRTK